MFTQISDVCETGGGKLLEIPLISTCTISKNIPPDAQRSGAKQWEIEF